MLQHLGDFPRKLEQRVSAVYEYTPMPPVGYPELAEEIWCHRYYLRNLCDEERFPDWCIVDHVPFLQVWPGSRVQFEGIRLYMQVYLYQLYIMYNREGAQPN